MNRIPAETPTRIDVWKNAAWTALVAATVILIGVKLFTGISFTPAFLLAVGVFMIAFGFAFRLSPRRYQ